MHPCTQNEISKLIDQLPNKTSSGHDEINNLLLKKLKLCLLVLLEVIFNMSILKGNFADAMKLGEVVPLHKNKDKMVLNNYGLNSLLTTISKILEKMIYSRVYKHMEDTNQCQRANMVLEQNEVVNRP